MTRDIQQPQLALLSGVDRADIYFEVAYILYAE